MLMKKNKKKQQKNKKKQKKKMDSKGRSTSTPVQYTKFKLKLNSFMSSEHINEKFDWPCHGFGYLSIVSDLLDLAT